MAYRLMNNAKSTINLKELDDNLRADIEAIKQGEYTICPNWDAVEKLLDCFETENTEDWRIEQLSNNMFAILPSVTTTFQKNQFEKLLAE